MREIVSHSNKGLTFRSKDGETKIFIAMPAKEVLKVLRELNRDASADGKTSYKQIPQKP